MENTELARDPDWAAAQSAQPVGFVSEREQCDVKTGIAWIALRRPTDVGIDPHRAHDLPLAARCR
jgi:hypothetical protein